MGEVRASTESGWLWRSIQEGRRWCRKNKRFVAEVLSNIKDNTHG